MERPLVIARRRICLLALVTACGAAAACGGGQAAADGANAPAPGAPASSGSAADATGSAAPAAPTASGAATTTATTLGDAGDVQGLKLSESHTVADTSAAASASPAGPKGPRGHDPGRGPADIRAIIMAHRDEARACYDKALPAHPGIEGDLIIQWTIDPKGKVTQVSLDAGRSQITEPSVIACISDAIRKIQFAASPAGYETKAFYPFNFHPHQARGQQGDAGL